MPKENTHLYFAKLLCDELTDKEYSSHLKDNEKAFYLGCVFPDACFYHPQENVEAVSRKLHGIGDNPYEIVNAFLTEAREQGSNRDLAFTMGYLSHLSLDRIFHPIINKLCKDDDDISPDRQLNEDYRHRLMETSLDREINKSYFMDKMIDIYELSLLRAMTVLSQRVEVPENELKSAFVHQHKINKLFMKKWAYLWARLLKRLGKSSYHSILPLFYAHLKKEGMELSKEINGTASPYGTREEESIDSLLAKAKALAERLFDYAFLVFNDTESSMVKDSLEVRQILSAKF